MNNPKIINCEQALRHLFVFLDRELEGDLQTQMQQHMEHCRSCFSRLAFEQTLKTHIRKTGAESAPDSLRDRISSLLQDFERKA